MSFLQHYTRSLFLRSFSTSSRCLEQLSNLSLPPKPERPHSRVVLIRNFPPTSTINDFLNLRGTNKPIESVIRYPEYNTVEIRYLEPYATEYIGFLAAQSELVLEGQALRVENLPHRPLPVEALAAIGLRAASRTLVLRNLRAHFSQERLEKKLKEKLVRHFGKFERIWIREDGETATVTFHNLMTAVKALKTLHAEGWKVHCKEGLPKLREFPDSAFPTVHLSGLPHGIQPQTVLKNLYDDLSSFPKGDPMRVFTNKKGAFLVFFAPPYAKKFCDIYQPPPGVTATLTNEGLTPQYAERAARRLGASRTIIIDGFKDPAITFDHIHQDFHPFGRVFYVYMDTEKAHARVVFTNISSSFKAIEDIYENRAKYKDYYGARITFGRHKQMAHYPLRPIFIRPTVSSTVNSPSVMQEDEGEEELVDEWWKAGREGREEDIDDTLDRVEEKEQKSESVMDAQKDLGTSTDSTNLNAVEDDYDYGDWQEPEESAELGEVVWRGRLDKPIGRYGFDVSPKSSGS
ncbi:hypothetical protein D9758_014483 [Tetrapyrgos nigripes]|uniref:RRM domain-containing protein n=1 Tax=Tetrapyrgos nigripes TaxID=182062 RepID=A0A8H5C827_9AGAR|nr:hypothetical protein D9758_014483 [Tetrapyrgos nigripes]